MKLVKFRLPDAPDALVGRLEGEGVIPLDLTRGRLRTLSDIFEQPDPRGAVESLMDEAAKATPLSAVTLLPPIDAQEVWAAGVTYIRSKAARMEESEAAASCYDRVYASPRPELFFKATPYRVSGPGESVRIRRDSEWNVPEPEVTLVMNSRLDLVGFTVGNDMSSRDIEGDNPLYLPQAKVYDACCGLGPCVTLASAMPNRDETGIELVVRRGGNVAFEAKTSAGQMARTYDELIEWLGRETSFPHGVLLLTGTGIVPDSDFSLEPGDQVDITIDGIGTLTNPVVRGE